ncbi:MAG: AraC family transcriptional regulator [Treponema sp.]|nr:AraC family transcriptional regulator [Treponema sp.]
MKYITGEKTPYTGFEMEVVFKDELFLPEITKDFYTMILFTSCTLTVESDETESYSDYGLLVLAPDHGIRKISVTSKSKNYSVQTLIFSSFGLNVNNKKFPDSFEYEFFKNFDTGYRKVSITPKLLETFTTNFANIESEMNIVQGHLWPCIARSYISELVILLSRNIFLSQIHTQNEDASEKKIKEIIEYFQYSMKDKITLDQVSRMFATNRTTLNSMFNKKYGLSAIAYLNKMRIENASIMLTNTAMPICDIAERTGFTDESYFSKAYKKMTGKTPSEYRLSIPHPHGLVWPEFSL